MTCPTCDKVFVARSILERHLKTSGHGGGGRPPAAGARTRFRGRSGRAAPERGAAAQDGGGRARGEQVRVPPLPGRLPPGQGPRQAQGEAVLRLVERRITK